jgi:hypothetical protein
MFAKDLPPALVSTTMRALGADPESRFATAKEMAIEMEKAVGGAASPSEISEWVESLSKNELHERMQYVESIERQSASLSPARTDPPPPPLNVRGMPSGTHPVNTNGGKAGGAGQDHFDLDMVEFHKEISTNNGTTNNGVFLGETEQPAGTDAATRLWYVAAAMIVLAILGAFLLAFGLYRSRSTSAVEPTPMPTMTIPVPSSAVAPVITRGPSAPSASAAAPAPSAAPTAAVTASARTVEIADPTPSAVASAAPITTESADPSTAPSGAPSAALGSTTAAATAPSAAPSAIAAKPWAPWTPPPKPAGKVKQCDPPYTLDASGKKHYKPECTLD